MCKIKKLKPCPYCRKTKYVYDANLIQFLGETLKTVFTSATNPAGGNLAIAARVISSGGSGMGVFSLPKLFYQGIFQDLDGHPLLRCTHCNSSVVACYKCGEFMLLERKPKTAELIECVACDCRFQTCERDETFDKLLKK